MEAQGRNHSFNKEQRRILTPETGAGGSGGLTNSAGNVNIFHVQTPSLFGQITAALRGFTGSSCRTNRSREQEEIKQMTVCPRGRGAEHQSIKDAEMKRSPLRRFCSDELFGL